MSSKFFLVSSVILCVISESKIARAESTEITCPPQIFSTTQYYNLTNEGSAALVIKNINVDEGVLPLDFTGINTMIGVENDKIYYFCEYGTVSPYSLQLVIKDKILGNCKVQGKRNKAKIICDRKE